MQAHIFKLDNPPAVGSTIPLLQIANYYPAFFIEPVKATSKFYSLQNGSEWLLKFFIGTAFEQTLTISFSGASKGANYPIGRACWANNYSDTRNDADLANAASQFLRGSGTLNLAQCTVLTSNRSLIADRDGFAYFSGDDDQFKRILLCQALAIAYTNVITSYMEATAASVRANQADTTLRLYEEILHFNAAFYFSLPVELKGHELFGAWQVLRKHYQLQVLNQELTQQLSDVAALLGAQRERQRAADEQAQKRELATQKAREDKAIQKQSSRLSFISIALAAVSLLSLFQLTPAQFSDNFAAWRAKVWSTEADKAKVVDAEPSAPSSKPRKH